MAISPQTIESIEAHFEQMVQMQRNKVLAIANRHLPHLTADDILNPHDFPALAHDMIFQFEDGILAGLLQSQISLRVNFFRGPTST